MKPHAAVPVNRFLPATRAEMEKLGVKELDIIIITGDAYIDSPFIGAAVIGRWLNAHGFTVGIIAQPDTASDDIARLGQPRLFWGVTAGSLDSLVANYTASGKPRRSDDLTPGGINNRRPDRASIAYANLIRKHFKNTTPIVMGGMEASLRRVAHYDLRDKAIRRSILFDAKADYLIYGMGEKPALDLARALREGTDPRAIRGLCYIAPSRPEGAVTLASHRECADDPQRFAGMFSAFYDNQDPVTGRTLAQLSDTRYLVQNPPPEYSTDDLDRIAALPFTREVHPLDLKRGPVAAQNTIHYSLMTHRGCYGECNFCSIAAHQGRRVISRSEASILDEARAITRLKGCAGVITDIGGPTANMYGIECTKKKASGACRHRRCLWPEPCPELPVDHRRQIKLLAAVAGLPGVRHAFVASGLRHDMILADPCGKRYLAALVKNHVSGQLKIAPEHTDDRVLGLMGKPPRRALDDFRAAFSRACSEEGKDLFLTYYFIAAHPGCGMAEMMRLSNYAHAKLKISPEQAQIFTPLPSTWSAVMYHTGKNPFTGEAIAVEHDQSRRKQQKDALRPLK